jgi:hypothetical protein
MSNFIAEAMVAPLPADCGGMPMEAHMENEESIGDEVGSEGLSVYTMLTKTEALQAKGMMGWEEDDISFLPVPKFG